MERGEEIRDKTTCLLTRVYILDRPEESGQSCLNHEGKKIIRASAALIKSDSSHRRLNESHLRGNPV